MNQNIFVDNSSTVLYFQLRLVASIEQVNFIEGKLNLHTSAKSLFTRKVTKKTFY